MLLTYVDESYTKERYFIAALMVRDDAARSLTAALDKVVEDTMSDHGGVSSATELHGYDLVAGKSDWQRLAPKIRVRIGVYNKALQAIADHNVEIIIRSVDIAGLDRRHPRGHDHPHSIVMTHLVERVDEHAQRLEQALLIADEVSEQDSYRRDLWHYQRSSTWGYRSRRITRVVDTLHFASSSASRLVQAADLVVYLARRRATHVESDPRAKQANEALRARITSCVVHDGCWWPQPR